MVGGFAALPLCGNASGCYHCWLAQQVILFARCCASRQKPHTAAPAPLIGPSPPACCSVEGGRGGIPTRTYLLADVKAKALARHGSFAHIQELKAKDKQVWQDILQVSGCQGWV